MSHNSVIGDEKRLKVLPGLQRKGLFNVKFEADNNGRTNAHQHLFMLKEELLTAEKGVSIPATVSKVPITDCVALLEAGWGTIEETQFSYA